MLFKDVRSHLKDIVRPESQEVAVEGCVMQGTQRQSISDERFSGRFRVCDDMGSIKEFLVTKTAERTLAPVGIEHTFPKASLVEPSSDGCRYVHPARGILILADPVRRGGAFEVDMFSVIDGDREREIPRIITHNENGPRRQVFPWNDPMKIDQREPELHR